MKKVFLFGALALSTLTANAGVALNEPGEGSDPAPAAVPAATLIGKWHVVDMKFEMPAGQKAPDPKEVKAMVDKQNMVYEFKADGTMSVKAAEQKSVSGTYKKTGNKIETVGESGEKESLDIIKLTDKELQVKLTVEKMTVIMERI